MECSCSLRMSSWHACSVPRDESPQSDLCVDACGGQGSYGATRGPFLHIPPGEWQQQEAVGPTQAWVAPSQSCFLSPVAVGEQRTGMAVSFTLDCNTGTRLSARGFQPQHTWTHCPPSLHPPSQNTVGPCRESRRVTGPQPSRS